MPVSGAETTILPGSTPLGPCARAAQPLHSLPNPCRLFIKLARWNGTRQRETWDFVLPPNYLVSFTHTSIALGHSSKKTRRNSISPAFSIRKTASDRTLSRRRTQPSQQAGTGTLRYLQPSPSTTPFHCAQADKHSEGQREDDRHRTVRPALHRVFACQ